MMQILSRSAFVIRAGRAIVGLMGALLCACAAAPQLEPELPTLGLAARPGSGGAGRDASVQILVSSGAWRSDPDDLVESVEPLHLEIENRSASPLLIRYDKIALVTRSGRRRYVTLPPFDLATDQVTARVPTEPEPTAFQIAPHHHPFLPRFTRMDGEFPRDDAYFQRHHRTLRALGLPTDAMLQAALPEGVLEPGGRVTGFLYLASPRIERPETELEFRFELTKLPDAESFGLISVPFVFR